MVFFKDPQVMCGQDENHSCLFMLPFTNHLPCAKHGAGLSAFSHQAFRSPGSVLTVQVRTPGSEGL